MPARIALACSATLALRRSRARFSRIGHAWPCVRANSPVDASVDARRRHALLGQGQLDQERHRRGPTAAAVAIRVDRLDLQVDAIGLDRQDFGVMIEHEAAQLLHRDVQAAPPSPARVR